MNGPQIACIQLQHGGKWEVATKLYKAYYLGSVPFRSMVLKVSRLQPTKQNKYL